MNKIESVRIDGFWNDKTVDLKFKQDVNFLIGVNGSGKTTIINLIVAALSADFRTLDMLLFEKITIKLEPRGKKIAYIEVEKKDNNRRLFYNIVFSIKDYDDAKARNFRLDEISEEIYHRRGMDYYDRNHIMRRATKDIHEALNSLVDVSWLSIHRGNPILRSDDRNAESTIDLKIRQLSEELVKYFSKLNSKCNEETEKFQKYIFESLLDINDKVDENALLEVEQEKSILKEIFNKFNLLTESVQVKLDRHFDTIEKIKAKLAEKKGIDYTDSFTIISSQRLHSIGTKWSEIVNEQQIINKDKDKFLSLINALFQKKYLVINENNELRVITQSGKNFPLSNLSSGEKQLLIILGQSLLQEQRANIYIADEPELSLHIEWQEKLVHSLMEINPNSQIIFATHSPDIVGAYSSSVINVESVING